MKNQSKNTKHSRLKIVLLLFLILTATLFATAQDKRFTASIFSDPNATLEDGFNVGASIDYQMSIVYFKAQVFTFPDLRGITYTEITGTPIGFNYHSRFNDLRIYSGLKLGVIHRGAPFPTYGIEAGIEYYFKGICIGIIASRDRRTDGKVWGVEPYFRDSGFIKIGFEL